MEYVFNFDKSNVFKNGVRLTDVRDSISRANILSANSSIENQRVTENSYNQINSSLNQNESRLGIPSAKSNHKRPTSFMSENYMQNFFTAKPSLDISMAPSNSQLERSSATSQPNIRKYNILKNSFLGAQKDESIATIGTHQHSINRVSTASYPNNHKTPINIKKNDLSTVKSQNGYLARLGKAGVDNAFFKSMNDNDLEQEPEKKPKKYSNDFIRQKVLKTNKRSNFLVKTSERILNEKSTRKEEQLTKPPIYQSQYTIDIDLKSEMIYIKNCFDKTSKEMVYTFDQLLHIFLDNYNDFVKLESNQVFMAQQIMEISNGNPIIKQFFIIKGQKLNKNITDAHLKNFVLYPSYKYVNHHNMKKPKSMHRQGTNSVNEENSASIFNRPSFSFSNQGNLSKKKELEKRPSNFANIGFSLGLNGARSGNETPRINSKSNLSVVPEKIIKVKNKPLIVSRSSSVTNILNGSKDFRPKTHIIEENSVVRSHIFDPHTLEKNHEHEKCEQALPTGLGAILMFKANKSNVKAHMSSPDNPNHKINEAGLFFINFKRTKEIIKILFQISKKLEDYIVEKQEEQYKSLNKNLGCKIKEIEHQKVLLETVKDKTLMGLFRADRLRGQKITDMLKEVNEDIMHNYGQNVVDRMSEFEDKNGHLGSMTKKVRMGSNIVNDLFFSK